MSVYHTVTISRHVHRLSVSLGHHRRLAKSHYVNKENALRKGEVVIFHCITTQCNSYGISLLVDIVECKWILLVLAKRQ